MKGYLRNCLIPLQRLLKLVMFVCHTLPSEAFVHPNVVNKHRLTLISSFDPHHTYYIWPFSLSTTLKMYVSAVLSLCPSGISSMNFLFETSIAFRLLRYQPWLYFLRNPLLQHLAKKHIVRSPSVQFNNYRTTKYCLTNHIKFINCIERV